MAPKGTTLSSMVDISDDDLGRTDFDMMPTPESQSENKQPAKRKAGRPKGSANGSTSKVTKHKVGRRVSGGSVLNATAAGAKSKSRKALAERTNMQDDEGDETEEVEEFDDMPAKTKKGAKSAKAGNAPAKQARRGKKAQAEEDEEPAPTKTSRKATTAAPKKTARGKRAGSVLEERVIPETQPEPMDIEQTEIPEMEETIMEETVIPQPEPVRRVASRQPVARARSISRQPDPYAPRHYRAGSASDTERAGEPALRRKLGEMTKKFENLELKYRSLKELGTNEAQSNFEKLRKSADQRAKDQDDIIASLKKEIASQKAAAGESRSLHKQITTLQSENQRLSSDNKSLSNSLQSAQNEVKTLQAKITSLRNNAPSEHSNTRNVPGSAVKARGAAASKANKEDEEKMKVMQMKEELYSDLTGLMIHNIKKQEDEDIYDCIQTGRNGTLRFHLSVYHPDPSTATPGTSYDEEEFAYIPILDQKNDRQLMEILPDYLQEEISFPRHAAPKFYEKIAKLMSTVFVEE